MCESFVATFKCESLDGHRLRSHSEDRMKVFHFIEEFYNPSRSHSALGYRFPTAYEATAEEIIMVPSSIEAPNYSTKSGRLQYCRLRQIRG